MLAVLACNLSVPGTPAPIPTLQRSPFSTHKTVYGFFPSPPEVSQQSVIDTYKAIGQHADAVLLQQSIPWNDFVNSAAADSAGITDLHNQYILAHQNNLEVILVVDALNGLNRTAFHNLPAGWKPSFGTPEVRAAFTNYVQRVVNEFHPRYLGLASEINTYADAHPEDFPNFLSLYASLYDWVKAQAPETQIFVTFQWEDLNNLSPFPAEGRTPYEVNWNQVEAFEPRLDLWVISTYPFAVFPRGADIPAGYYSRLKQHTQKPLAVSEGGFTSRDVGAFHGTPQDQVDYLNAIHDRLGDRLVFWIYLLLSDFNLDSYAKVMNQQGHGGDVGSLSLFASVGLRESNGTPKAGLAAWDQFRSQP